MTRIEIKISGPNGWYALIDRKIGFEATNYSIALTVLEYLNDKVLISVNQSSFRNLPETELQSKLLALGYAIESWKINDGQ